jgi:hypothetical protein
MMLWIKTIFSQGAYSSGGIRQVNYPLIAQLENEEFNHHYYYFLRQDLTM